MIPFKPRLGRPGPMFVCNTTGLWEFRGDSSVAGRRPVASLPRIDCRVCALPLVQVAKQGDGLIASAELDGVHGYQDLPCFRAKG